MFNGSMKDFHNRQAQYQKKHQENLQSIASKTPGANCSFKPQINMTSQIICESDPNRNNLDQVTRLYEFDRKKKEVVREIHEAEMYGGYDFQPQINKVSKSLAGDFRQELLMDNMSNPAAKMKFQEKRNQFIREQEAELTFKPQTYQNKKFEDIPATIGNHENSEQFSMNLKARLKEKQQRIAAERRTKEMKELEECTFTPMINNDIHDNRDEIVVVKGLGRHLELQELKKKQVEEKRLRDIEVFGINHKFAANAR